jgi:hypothetical protein
MPRAVVLPLNPPPVVPEPGAPPSRPAPPGAPPDLPPDAPDFDQPPDDADLDQAIALLRDVIRRLHPDRLLPADLLRQLAELRHQLATLCTLLRTRHTLAIGARAARDAELDNLIARALDDLDRAEAEQAAARAACGEVDR